VYNFEQSAAARTLYSTKNEDHRAARFERTRPFHPLELLPVAKTKGKTSFDLETFLATTNGGRSITKYKKDAIIVSQGDPCEGILYIREGTCKSDCGVGRRKGSGGRAA
jgi:CRP-like cAMP-binding protein